MKSKFYSVCAGALALGLLAGSLRAAVVDSADVNGLHTFQDTNTGRIWLDMDNFFNASASTGTQTNAMISIAQANGFVFATTADVLALLNPLTLGSGEWASYAAVMGYGHPRQLIWGALDDGDGSPYGWAYAFSGDGQWGYAANATDGSVVQNGDSPGSVDMGIFAYRGGDGNRVPESGSTLALLGLALTGFAVIRRRR